MMYPEQLLLDVATAARLLGLSERTTWSLIARGQLCSVKVGRRRLVPRHALEAFVDELAEPAPARNDDGGADGGPKLLDGNPRLRDH